MIEELRKKAEEKKIQLDSDSNASEKDKKTINDILEFLKNPEGFNHVPQSTVFNIFTFVGYKVDIKNYIKMYDEIMNDVNKTYVYVDPEDLMQR